jgi:hypothetical protein
MQATEYLVQNNLDNYGIKGAYYLNSIFRLKKYIKRIKGEKECIGSWQ